MAVGPRLLRSRLEPGNLRRSPPNPQQRLPGFQNLRRESSLGICREREAQLHHRDAMPPSRPWADCALFEQP